MLALMLAAIVAARPALAARNHSRAEMRGVAHAVHTDASGVRSTRLHTGVRHRHHRHAALERQASAAATTPRPQPLRPERPRPDPRAALPRLVGGAHGHGESRAHDRTAAALPGRSALIAVATIPLDICQNDSTVPPGGSSHAGRGPPRAASSATLLPPRAGQADLLLPIPAPAASAPGSSERTAQGIAALARARMARPFASASLQPELLQGCSHACRPEGAAACRSLPSFGGPT